jgi:N4-gp56 family major capsid protein
MELTTFGDISPRTAGYASRELLKRGAINVVTDRFGQAKPLPKNSGKTISFRRYNSLATATAPLAEGVTPTGQKLTYSDVTATLDQYGDMVHITDVIQDTHEDPVLNEAIKLCAEQIQETIESIRIARLKGGTTVFYAGGVVTTRATVNSTITRGDLRRINRYLQKYKGKVISNIVKAGPYIATEPVAPAYFALCHTDLDSDIRNLNGFVEVEKYSNSDKAQPFEIGKCENIRFICTPYFTPWVSGGASSDAFLAGGVAPSSAASCDVYPILIIAQDAYGIVPLQGENAVSPTVLNPNKPDKSDPLGQKGFVSWKMWQTVAILNESWLVRLECAATANPD